MTHATLIVEENEAGGVTMGYQDTGDDDVYYAGYTIGIWYSLSCLLAYYSLTYSPSHILAHLLVHSLTCSPTCLSTHSLNTFSLRGVCISIVGALFTSSGLCLQKIVHKRVSADPSIGPLYKQPTYIAGTHPLTHSILSHSLTHYLNQVLLMWCLASC